MGNVLSECWLWVILLGYITSARGVVDDVAVPSDDDSLPELLRAPVFITEPPITLDFLNTDGALASCSAYGSPAPALEWVWEHTNKPVDNVEGLLQVNANGSLHFLEFRDPAYFRSDIHEGKLRCVASNRAGTIVSRAMQVKTALQSRYSTYNVRVNHVDVTLGDTAVLKCHVNPPYVQDYVTVTGWTTAQPAEQTTSSDQLQSGKKYRTLPSSGELYILNTAVEDTYEVYNCHTHNQLTGENKTSEGAVLYAHDAVDSAPMIQALPMTLKVSQGSTIELPCVANGHPVPKYSWTKDDHPLLTAQDRVQQFGGNVVIEGVMISDSGVYLCHAENKLGTVETTVQLIVSAPLSAYINPSQQTVDTGKPAIFNCSVYGHPVDSVTWYKDGQPVPLTDTHRRVVGGNQLVVDTVEVQDEGMYQCLVSNGEDNAQAAGQLTLGDATPVIIEASSDDSVTPGSKVTLKCVATGTPTPFIKWTLDGEQITSDEHHSLGQFNTPDGTVVGYVNVTQVQVTDGGQYRCVALSSVGSDSQVVKLIVFGVPFIRPMKNVTAVAREMLVVRCLVTGYPVHYIRWTKGGDTLPANTRQHVSDDGTLTVGEMAKTRDEGEYTCEARNEQGDGMSRSIFVLVIEPPKLDEFSFPLKKEHDRVSVLCVVSGDLPIHISWDKDGRVLPPHVTVRISDDTSHLQIDDVRPEDSGNYTCTASNDAATTSHTGHLQVNVPPDWIAAPQDSIVILHQDVLINCSTRGDPTPNIVWKKAKGPGKTHFEEIDFTEASTAGAGVDSSITQLDNGSLAIVGATEDHAGFYSCHADNGVEPKISKIVELIVYVPAKFTEREKNYTVQRDQNITLNCTALGRTPLSIAWSFNSTSLDWQHNRRLLLEYEDLPNGKVSKLTIYKTRMEDTGFYVCSSQNAFGSDSMMIQLVVQERPDPPTNVQVIFGDSQEITLGWSPAYDGNSAILGYLVEYKVASVDWTDNSTGSVSVGPEYVTVNIRGLHPAYGYQLRVRARNAVGLSTPSSQQLYITGEEEPSGPANDVEVVATGSQTLRVTWNPPDLDQQNGEILGYYIGYKIFNTSAPYMYLTKSVSDVVQTKPDLEQELTGLNKFTKYAVHVQAYNQKGAGPLSHDVTRLTLEDVPSQYPQSVQGAPSSSTMIVVRWSPPPYYTLHGILQGYKVIYKPVREDEDERDEVVLTSTSLTGALYGLEKHTNYSIQVLAFTRMGEGVRSPAIYVVTLQDYPEVPADIKVITAGSESILVSWRPPLHSNGIITRYTVHIRDLTNPSQTKEVTEDLAPHSLSLLVRDLETGHKYGFRVGASTIVGKGPLTREDTAFTEDIVAAQIASFPGTVFAPWQNDVILPCQAVGTPQPNIVWTLRDAVLTPDSSHQVFGNGSLWLTDLKAADAGDYVCRAENTHGADEITVSLVVEAPPKEPTLTVAATTANTIQVNWRTGSNGGNKLQGFTLYYKREHADWTTVLLGSQNRSYTATDLKCGTPYKFHMRAYNGLGEGMPSHTLTARTNGSTPIMPPQSMILVHINATFVILDLRTWQTGGCPITDYDIQYQVMGDTSWTTVANHLDSLTVLYTVELHPETWYVMRVTAHNDAGSTESVLKFSTKTYTGSTIEPIMIVHERSPAIYQRAYIMVPLVFFLVLLAVLAVWLTLYCRRRRNELKCKVQNKTNLRKDLTAETSLMSDLEKSISDIPTAVNSPDSSRGRNINLLTNQNEDVNRKLPAGEQRTSWIFASSGKAGRDLAPVKNTEDTSMYATLRGVPVKSSPIRNNPEKICNLDQEHNRKADSGKHCNPFLPPPVEMMTPATPSSTDSGVILNPNNYRSSSEDPSKMFGPSPRSHKPRITPPRPTPMPWRGIRQRPSTVSTVSSTQDELMQALQNATLQSVPSVSYEPDKPSSTQTVSTDTTSEAPSLCRFTQSPALPNESRLARCEVPWYNQPANRTTPGPGMVNLVHPVAGLHQTTQKPSPLTRQQPVMGAQHVVAKKLFGVHCEPKSSSSNSSASEADTTSEDIPCSFDEEDASSQRPSEASTCPCSEPSTRHPSETSSVPHSEMSADYTSRASSSQLGDEEYDQYLTTPKSRALLRCKPHTPSPNNPDPTESVPLVGALPDPSSTVSRPLVEGEDESRVHLLDRRYCPVRDALMEEEEEEEDCYTEDFTVV